MLRILILSFVFVQTIIAQAQRGGEGGLIIQNFFLDEALLQPIQNELRSHSLEHSVKVEHFAIDSRGRQIKSLTEFYKADFYDVNAPVNHAMYLPAYEKPQSAGTEIVNQRLVLSWSNQKMIIDFLNIVQANAGGYFNYLESVVIKPGHYTINLDSKVLYDDIENIGVDNLQQISKAIQKGINTGDNRLLIKHGVLSYSPTQMLYQSEKEIQEDSSSWLKLTKHGTDTIVLFANGLLYTDGACNARVLFNLQKNQNGIWEDFHSSWIQMDCGLSYLNLKNEISVININLMNVPNNGKPLSCGEYRFMVMDKELKTSYSESFIITEKAQLNPEKYKTLERWGYGIHGVSTNANKIIIRTPDEATIVDNQACYYFRYYYISKPIANLISGRNNVEEDEYQRLFESLSKATMEINGKPYSGKLKIAMSTRELNPGAASLSNGLYIINYSEGTQVNVQFLKNVDLNTEQPLKSLY